ncbi:hypothetical protein P175DRAFT_0277758 [Aspergillus ochraceoroseus IBT 24754]|uniref:Uncharacterized protein n=3 Tax=Aspergillus subgen. Nidulantes TaxID=2720870 RepID=A0A0F8XA30_9EURO|nr:uncharacterized protein P175DRAFT_0277758 [Aspergillus ochraceoroseus IBT 24754]KKK18535.1 hypothetical protein AOCH_000759 [Aspergillus ochraceoroseus]KKK26405.1 hypothetical protein ARAM_002189 [Aspergillus rambellii]PTU20280.1 hypothetical protein P175DRAFT_0277758 [Aspergillus ochraceoroseus IBT 24754]
MPPTVAWIWPKDPRPGNPSRWPRRWRLFDVLTNKGPDIFVGKIHDASSGGYGGPTRRQSQASEPPYTQRKRQGDGDRDARAWGSSWQEDHRGCRCGGRGRNAESKRSLPWTRRGSGVQYDFRTRKYAVPDRGTWRGVEYCDGDNGRSHEIPLRYWDCYGREYPASYWHDVAYGAHGDHQR